MESTQCFVIYKTRKELQLFYFFAAILRRVSYLFKLPVSFTISIENEIMDKFNFKSIELLHNLIDRYIK